MTMPDVGDLLGPIFDLLALLSRRLRGRLGPDELRRARGLLRLLGSPDVDPRRFARSDVTGRVQLVPVSGPIVIASVHDVGGGGLRITARRLPAVGTRGIAHFLDPARGVRVSFPVIVAWLRGGGGAQAGLRFTGLPRRRHSTGAVGRTTLRYERPTVPAKPIAPAADQSDDVASSYSLAQ